MWNICLHSNLQPSFISLFSAAWLTNKWLPFHRLLSPRTWFFSCPTLSLASLADKVQHLDSGRLMSSSEEKRYCVSVTGLLCHLSLNNDFPGDCHYRSYPLPVWSSPAHQLLPVAMRIAVLCTEGKKGGDTMVLQGCSAASQPSSALTPFPSQLQRWDELLRT